MKIQIIFCRNTLSWVYDNFYLLYGKQKKILTFRCAATLLDTILLKTTNIVLRCNKNPVFLKEKAPFLNKKKDL